MLRRVLIVTAVVWLGAGLAGAYGYVHRYALYRGFTPPRTAAGVAQGTTREVAFHSPALRSRVSFLVHLPPGYARAAAAGQRFPVLYVIHGHPGSARGT